MHERMNRGHPTQVEHQVKSIGPPLSRTHRNSRRTKSQNTRLDGKYLYQAKPS
jgi:hypothetical protein